MTDTQWMIDGREFVNCNCSYGCPCQFNGLPTHGNCQAVAGAEIDKGHHGSTKLDGLRFVGIFRWPGPIHEGKGEAAIVVDERATPEQRSAGRERIQQQLPAYQSRHAEHKPNRQRPHGVETSRSTLE